MRYERTFCAGCKDYHVFEDGRCMECREAPGKLAEAQAKELYDFERVRMTVRAFDRFFPAIGGGYGN